MGQNAWHKDRQGKVADRFTELATELANAAPHFLPTLYEELARIFDSVSNTKYASRFFSKQGKLNELMVWLLTRSGIKQSSWSFRSAVPSPPKS